MEVTLNRLQGTMVVNAELRESGVHSLVAGRDTRVPTSLGPSLFDVRGGEIFIGAEGLQVGPVAQRTYSFVSYRGQLIDQMIEISLQTQRLFGRHADQVP